MTIWNLGSINIDHVYSVPHLPAPGETLAATGYAVGLGGKGANQSIAAALAGARVHHIGAVGEGADWALSRMRAAGIDTAGVRQVDTPTGHAIIAVDPGAENMIMLFPGANLAPDADHIDAALTMAAPGDLLLLQNETSAQPDAARLAKERGLRVIYSAAPFQPEAVAQVLPYVDLLVMNEVEAAQLRAALGDDVPPVERIVTMGAQGARWEGPGDACILVPAFPVRPVDTTGAGDCFIGNLAAGMDAGLPRAEAMRRAAAAAALQVTRPGAAEAMPTRAEVEAFLAN